MCLPILLVRGRGDACERAPVYSETVVLRHRPVRLVQGWRQTWKRAYTPGDERLWATLGTQFQFRYDGSWHRESHIKIAQRPLNDIPWSHLSSTPTGDAALAEHGRTGVLGEDIFHGWKISIVERNVGNGPEGRPMFSSVTGDDHGHMAAVFEKEDALHIAQSHDGGTSWRPSQPFAQGYAPSVAWAQPGELGVAFYTPSGEGLAPGLKVLRQKTGHPFDEASVLSASPSDTIGKNTSSKRSESLHPAPSISALEELFFVAWIRRFADGQDGDAVMTSRAARDGAFDRLGIELPGDLTLGQPAKIIVTAENKFHMRVNRPGQVRLTAGAPTHSNDENPNDNAPSPVKRTTVGAPALLSSAPVSLELQQGQATGWIRVDESTSLGIADAALGVLESTSLRAELLVAEGASYTAADPLVVPGDASGNYHRAVTARRRLLRQTIDEGTGQEFYYQVEYMPTDLEPSEIGPQEPVTGLAVGGAGAH